MFFTIKKCDLVSNDTKINENGWNVHLNMFNKRIIERGKVTSPFSALPAHNLSRPPMRKGATTAWAQHTHSSFLERHHILQAWQLLSVGMYKWSQNSMFSSSIRDYFLWKRAKHFADFLNLVQYKAGLAERLEMESGSVPTLLGSATNLGQVSKLPLYHRVALLYMVTLLP